MPQPVKPATKMEATRPRERGKSAEMWNWARWKVMLPRPIRMAAGMKAFAPEDEDMPNSTRAVMLSSTPAAKRCNHVPTTRHGLVAVRQPLRRRNKQHTGVNCSSKTGAAGSNAK